MFIGSGLSESLLKPGRNSSDNSPIRDSGSLIDGHVGELVLEQILKPGIGWRGGGPIRRGEEADRALVGDGTYPITGGSTDFRQYFSGAHETNRHGGDDWEACLDQLWSSLEEGTLEGKAVLQLGSVLDEMKVCTPGIDAIGIDIVAA